MDICVAGGGGFVGKETVGILSKFEPDIYDPPKGETNLRARYDFCFICVPTPQNEDGSCDTGFVIDVLARVKADVFVCLSTIPPDMELPANLVFQPEYVASSSPYPAPLANPRTRGFVIIGGEKPARKKVRRLYERIYPPTTRIMETDSKTARVIKYMENSFIATYVSFCNEFYNICRTFGVDYDEVREGFLLDPRMTPWWTYVYPDKRGWGGHCLPKDTSAIVHASTEAGYSPELLKAVRKFNEDVSYALCDQGWRRL